MRFNLVPFLLAGASMVQYAAASPLRVTVVTSAADVSTNVSFGDIRPIPILHAEPMQSGASRSHCSQFKEKAVMLSNKFRAAFGLPLIETFAPINSELKPMHATPRPPVRNGEVRILPITPTFRSVEGMELPSVKAATFRYDGRYHEHDHMMREHHHRRGSFLHRVHRALMTLGPWEGRAVAFVLGCGIGVLLRMFWVMAIIVARAIHGGRSESDVEVHDILVFEADAEDIIVPPPQYTDEKVALAEPGDAERDVKA